MDGIYDRKLNAGENIAGLIRSEYSGMCSGEPRGVNYPNVPSVAEICGELGVSEDGKLSETQWIRACELIGVEE